MPVRLDINTVRNRIKLIDNGEYSLVGEYTTSTKPITVLHTCGKLITVKAKGFLQEGAGRCKDCYPPPTNKTTKQITEKEFISRCKEKLGEEYSYVSGYKNTNSKVLMKHNECNNMWEVTPHMLLGSKQRRCPTCANLQRGKYLHSDTYLEDVLSSKKYGCNYEWLEEYNNDNKQKLLIRHKKCGFEYRVRPNDFQQGYRCPSCSIKVPESYGVIEIKEILNKLNIPFLQETTYEGLVYKNPLKFDFDIELNEGHRLIIEFDGILHFKTNNLITEDQLEKSKIRDAIKNKFCEDSSHLHLHRINYKQDVEKELMKILNQYFYL